MTPTTRKIFLDLNGVLADFDAGLVLQLGRSKSSFSSEADLWKTLSSTPGFFARLPWKPDGQQL